MIVLDVGKSIASVILIGVIGIQSNRSFAVNLRFVPAALVTQDKSRSRVGAGIIWIKLYGAPGMGDGI